MIKQEADALGITPEALIAEKVRNIQSRLGALFLSGERVDIGSQAGACLGPVLAAIGWAGEARHLQEALPHFDEVNTLDGLRSVLARLNLETVSISLSLSALRTDCLPCLFAAENGNIYVVISDDGHGKWVVFDGAANAFCHINSKEVGPGTAYLIREMDFEAMRKDVERRGWIQALLVRFRRTFVSLFALTFVINLLALVVPLYVMNVYDKALGAKSPMTLTYLLAGVVIALCLEVFLRSWRSRYLAYLGSRVEALVTTSAFERLLHLPLIMTETAPVGSQVTRLKQFESVREVFVGPLASTILDLPFFLVFLCAIFAIGGVLGLVPVALIAVFFVMALVTVPMTRLRVRQAGDAKSQNRNFLMELATKRDTIRDAGAENVWVNRFRDLAASTLFNQLEAQKFSMVVQTISQSLVVVAGTATIGLGAFLAMKGELSAGALIALMTLVWRVLSPIQSAFLSLNRIGQTRESFEQINSLMKLQTERQPGELPTFFRKFKGKIDLRRVAFRYSAKSEPALRGVDLSVKPGEFVAITGPSGAGKSTLLKLIARLYQPQSGLVVLDNLDLRQLDVAEIRQGMGYVRQRQSFFYGTVEQNLKLANPAASRNDLVRALVQCGAAADAKSANAVLQQRLNSMIKGHMSSGWVQQLMLAQAIVKNASIYLMDEPGNNLDVKGDEALKRLLQDLQGSATIIVVTHRPSHLQLADRVVVMDQGQIAAEGPPEEILPELAKMQQARALANS